MTCKCVLCHTEVERKKSRPPSFICFQCQQKNKEKRKQLKTL